MARIVIRFEVFRPRTLRERRLHITSYRRIRLRFCVEDCGSRNGRLFNKGFGRAESAEVTGVSPAPWKNSSFRNRLGCLYSTATSETFRVTTPVILRITSVNGQK